MIDTVGFYSPDLDENIAQVMEKKCLLRQGVEMETGEIKYRITTGFLEGSFDSRISIRVEREKWTNDLVEYMRSGKQVPVRVPSKPYLRVECSIHKAMAGHNVYGGPIDFHSCSKWFIGLLSEIFEENLPDWSLWTVYRVDVAEVFELSSFESVQEWFRGMKNCSYPRRKPQFYGLSGLFFPGSTTCTKFYHKGPEFAKHDRKRVSKFMSLSELNNLQETANKILRVEVEIKSRKLKDFFNGVFPTISQVTNDFLEKIYDSEVIKVLREGRGEAETVYTARAVEERLYRQYDASLAGPLLGTWFRLSVMGEQAVKDAMKKRTFYLHKKQLVEAGCSWLRTDVVLREFKLLPMDFSPVRDDSRRLSFVHYEVLQKLKVA